MIAQKFGHSKPRVTRCRMSLAADQIARQTEVLETDGDPRLFGVGPQIAHGAQFTVKSGQLRIYEDVFVGAIISARDQIEVRAE